MLSLYLVFTIIGVVSALRFNGRTIVRQRGSTTSLEGINSKILTNSVATILTAALIMGPNVNPVAAAVYGGFGKAPTAVLDPKTAVIDEELVKSDEFKAGLKGLNDLKAYIKDLQDSIAKDSQLDFIDQFKKTLNVATIRDTLNKFNSIFSEDTQKGTDRLIRGVIQDITELEREVKVKVGKQRSDAKVEAIQKRLAAASKALSDLSAFYSR